MDAVVRESHSTACGEDVPSDSAKHEKPPGAARPESFPPRASQCDRESRPCRGVPSASKWQYVRKAERRTLPAPSKSQSSATAKTAERHLVIQFSLDDPLALSISGAFISLGFPFLHEIPSKR